MTGYRINREGLYCTPDDTWSANPEDAAIYYDGRSEVDVDAARLGGVVEMVTIVADPPSREWNQALGCWRGEEREAARESQDVADVIDSTCR